MDKKEEQPLFYGFHAATQRYKSLGRALRRGRVEYSGIVVPSKPFNNRGNTSKRKGKHSRTINEQCKKMYEYCKGCI